MTELPPEPPREPSEFHRDRRQHGGEIDRLNDDQLAELTEEERVDAGLDPFEPDEVPPATDDPVPTDVTDSPVYQDARTEIDNEEAKGELRLGRDGFPPTRYEES
ncbi:MAG TPA: hypothetical protein VMH35_11515 [Streptosporangiaceae bacterium]|nr:hypothetical protein [Streptosporangiaceae bacterium]